MTINSTNEISQAKDSDLKNINWGWLLYLSFSYILHKCKIFGEEYTLEGASTESRKPWYKLESVHPDLCEKSSHSSIWQWLLYIFVQTAQPYSADPGKISFRILGYNLVGNCCTWKNEIAACQCPWSERFWSFLVIHSKCIGFFCLLNFTLWQKMLIQVLLCILKKIIEKNLVVRGTIFEVPTMC
jgi:hypothetical protein